MDTAGFEQFYRAHHGRLATVLAATTGDLHVARDEDPLSRPIAWWLKEADTRIDGAFEAAFAAPALTGGDGSCCRPLQPDRRAGRTSPQRSTASTTPQASRLWSTSSSSAAGWSRSITACG